MKHKIFSLSILLSLCLCSCNTQQSSKPSKTKALVFNEPTISSKVEVEDMTSNEQDYLSFKSEEQEYLKNYFDLWRSTIIDLSKHEVNPYNYKDEALSTSIKHMSDLFDEYKKDKEKYNCLMDFYKISYVDAKYQLDYLQSTLNVTNGESSFVYDDTYDRYVYDLAQIYNNLGEIYFPDDFKNN